LAEIHALIEVIWPYKMAENWRTAVIGPIYKRGYKMKCSSYRGITLLNVCYELLTTNLYRCLVPYFEEILGDYQCCCRKGRKTTDIISEDVFLKNLMVLI